MKTSKQVNVAIALCSVLASIVATPVVAKNDDSRSNHRPSKKSKRCCKPTLITQRMVNEGLVIKDPGVYVFCSNIEYSPGISSDAMKLQDRLKTEQYFAEIDQYVAEHGSNFNGISSLIMSQMSNQVSSSRDVSQNRAITIASNDVYIDMKNYTLAQGDSSPGIIGFWLEPGYENISIVNGTVRQFEGAGIASFIDLADIFVGEITNVEGDGSLVTYTYEPPAGAPTLQPGDYVNVAGVSPSQYNGFSLLVASTPTPTSFTVADLSTGTYVSGGEVTVNDPENQKTLKNLLFENLTIIDNCPNGISNGAMTATGLNLDCYLPNNNSRYLDTFVYSNVQIENCRINHNGIVGLHCRNVDNLTIQNTQMNNTYSEQAGFVIVSGLYMRYCRNLKMVDSECNYTNNGASQVSGLIVVATLQAGNRNGVFQGCQFNSSTALFTPNPNFLGRFFCGGLLSSQQKNMLYENCQFNDTKTVNWQVNNGYHCSDTFPAPGNGSNKFVNCQFNGYQNDGPSEFMAGICYNDIDNLIVEDCQFANYRNNYGSVAPAQYPKGNTFGIYYQGHSADAANLDVENMECCRVKNTTITDFHGDGQVAGIMFIDVTGPEFVSDVNPELTNVVLENNVISKMIGTSTFHKVAGIMSFDSFEGTPGAKPFLVKNFVVDGNTITDVMRTVEGETSNVAGIYLDSVTNPVVTNNTIIATTNGILFTNHEETGLKVTNNGLVQNNRVSNCSVAGYVDTTEDGTTSAWLQNVSYLNPMAYDIIGLDAIQNGYDGTNVWWNIRLPQLPQE